MKKLLPIVFSLLLTTLAFAQSADNYFHGGAQSFINADLQTAINEVQEGLSRYPNDAKLNALMEKLQQEQEKQQQQQQQQQEQQQNQEQQSQQEQDQNQEQQDQENQEQQEQQEQSQNQDEQNPQEMNPEELQSQKISKEDAEKILQALAQKEKELLKEFKKKKTDGSAKHDKDW